MSLYRTSPPCLGCTDRELGCHAKCTKYKQYTLQHEAERAELQRQAKEQNSIREYTVTEILKLKYGIGRKKKVK